MHLSPFQTISGISFGCSRDDVIRIKGKPMTEGENRLELLELKYESEIYRFDPNGVLEEATVNAPVISVGVVSISFQALPDFLTSSDPSTFPKVGFLVSPLLGVAFDPNYPCWITAFPKDAVEKWRAI
jgi:hypothetical protein